MCGRYALISTPARLLEHFGLAACPELPPRYNIPPGTDIAAIRQSPEGERVLHLLRWGLVPHWARDPAIGNRLNNARADTVADKPAFRDAFQHRRCLIPADGFYEWKAEGRLKQPYYISLGNGEPFAMAGLWESWRAADGTVLRSCCVITTDANSLVAGIHDRMPVIVAPEHWQDWLSAPAAAVTPLLAPYPEAAMRAWPVDRRVSRAAEEGADLIRPLAGS
jgi:putative SOS response-associated peptidase YedK